MGDILMLIKDDNQNVMFNNQNQTEESDRRMQERLQERTKNINKGVDTEEGKETREEGIISLRKKKRLDKLNKFRNPETNAEA